MYLGSSISITQHYKYLVIEVDSALNLNTQFEKCYKRESGRLGLVAKVRHCLDVSSAKSIYNLMNLPTFTYHGTQANILASFYDCSLRIIQGKSSTKPAVQSFENANNIRACKLVCKCFDREAN